MSARHRRPAPPRKLDGRLGRGVIGAGAAGLTAVFAVAPIAHAAPSDPTSSSAPSAPGGGDGSSAAPSAPAAPTVPVSTAPNAPTAPSVPSAPVSLGGGSSSSSPSAPAAPTGPSSHRHSKAVHPKATLAADFGSNKLRVGVQIKSGAYVPDGTTTAGSNLLIQNYTPDGQKDGDPVPCTTVADTAQTGDDPTATFCQFDNPPFGDYAGIPGDSQTITQVPPANSGLVADTAGQSVPPCTSTEGDCTPETVVLTDTGIPPTAADDTATTPTGKAVNVKVLDNDESAGAPVTDFSVTQPAHGSAQAVTPLVRASADATPSHDYVTYTPDAGFVGTDHFSYSFSTANGSATADVTVTVDAPPPIAHDDAAKTKENTAVSVDVLANDDANGGGALHIDSVGTASHGQLNIDGADVTYTPASDFVGTDHFDYVAATAYGTSTATVTITVSSSGSNPVKKHKHRGSGNGDGNLASTGTDSEQLLGIAAGLLAVGGAATAVGRRRRSRGSDAR